MAIIKYETKPVMIEAVQWKGDNHKEVEDFCGVVAGLDSLMDGSYIVKNERGRVEAYSFNAFHSRFQRHLVWEDNI